MTRRWVVAACLLGACGPGDKRDAPASAASRPAVPVTDVLARWARELPATFVGDPQTPPGPPASAATIALRDAFLADQGGREGTRARNNLESADDGVAACEQMIQAADTPPETRVLLLDTVARMPDALCLPPLLRVATADRDPVLRRRAAWHLGQKDATLALPQLVLRLRPLYEHDPEALVWVADTVVRLGNPTGLPILTEMFQVAAVRDLAGRLLVEALRRSEVACEDDETWDSLRTKAGQLANRMHAQPPPPLSPQMRIVLTRLVARLPSSNLRDVDESRFILAHLGAIVAPVLAESALDQNRYVRIHSLEILGELGPLGIAALPAARALLNDPLAEIYAVEVLGRLGDPSVFDAIAARLDAPRLDLRIGALKGLAALADPRCVPLVTPLFEKVQTPIEERVHAAHALARTSKEPRARQFLEDALARGTFHEPTLRAMLSGLR